MASFLLGTLWLAAPSCIGMLNTLCCAYLNAERVNGGFYISATGAKTITRPFNLTNEIKFLWQNKLTFSIGNIQNSQFVFRSIYGVSFWANHVLWWQHSRSWHEQKYLLCFQLYHKKLDSGVFHFHIKISKQVNVLNEYWRRKKWTSPFFISKWYKCHQFLQ